MRTTLSLLCLFLTLWSGVAEANPRDTTPIADFSFHTAFGKTATLREFRGSTVVLHFLASWCGECILEAPSLNTLARDVAKDGIAVVGIAIDDHPQAAKSLVDRLNIRYPLLIDTARRLKSFFKIRSVPVTYILTPHGQTVEFTDPESGRSTLRVNGPRQWDSPAALRSVRQAALLEARPQTISNR